MLVYAPDPNYSDAARRAGIQGTLTARLTIAPDGHVVTAVVQNQLGYGLEKEAEQALLRWRFQALAADCPQVATPASVEVNFRLGGRR